MHYLFFQARNYTENTDFLYSFSEKFFYNLLNSLK